MIVFIDDSLDGGGPYELVPTGVSWSDGSSAESTVAVEVFCKGLLGSKCHRGFKLFPLWASQLLSCVSGGLLLGFRDVPEVQYQGVRLDEEHCHGVALPVEEGGRQLGVRCVVHPRQDSNTVFQRVREQCPPRGIPILYLRGLGH